MVIYRTGELPFNNIMDIAEIRRKNLKLVIEQRCGGVASELARLLDKQPSELSRIFSKNPAHRRNVGSRLARRIEKVIGKEPGWMDREQTTLSAAAPAATRAAAQLKIRRDIPVISWVQAGQGSALGPVRAARDITERVTATTPVGPRAYALRIVGDSMEPKFPEGAIIIVDPDAAAQHGSFVVAHLRDTGETTFKQLVVDGKRYLKPVNPRYPIIEVNKSTTLCGVVKQMVMSFS